MRLIDADMLLERISSLKNANLYEVGRVVALIITQPTAYNIDKVIEQMEEMLNPEIEKKRCFSASCDITDNCTDCVLKYAIEIVKAGGKNETNI